LFYYRYWLRFDISDHTTSTTCTIFDAEAKKIIGTSISELLDSLEGNTKDMPKAIKKLYGKVFIFHFKLNDSNLVEGRQGFFVNRTYVPDDNLERKLNSINATEVSLIFLFLLQDGTKRRKKVIHGKNRLDFQDQRKEDWKLH
jgi:hypothetical protein